MSECIPFLRADAGDALALIDDTGVSLSHADLVARSCEWRDRLAGPRGLVALFVRNRAEDVAAMFGAMMAGHSIALFNPDLAPESKHDLCEKYSVQWRMENGDAQPLHEACADLHPDLFLLLSTSGSTGSAKLVRLSRSAVVSNALAIAVAMDLKSDEIASGHLPLHYSYGFSILTSHLVIGGAVRLTGENFIRREFWTSVAQEGITHLPGVPYHFQIMERLRYESLDLPDLRILSQAGGALSLNSRKNAHNFMDTRDGRFLVMYGQTEAAPRMSTLAHEDFVKAPNSVGRALGGGRFVIEHGEVTYEGPNVMMGYAEDREDLAKGDEAQGRLLTGDLGWLDEDGRLTLSGRAKRMGKLYGLRVNLDEVEKRANEIVTAAVVQRGDRLRVVFVRGVRDEHLNERLKRHLMSGSTLPPTCWEIIERDTIPTTERAKIDYAALEAME